MREEFQTRVEMLTLLIDIQSRARTRVCYEPVLVCFDRARVMFQKSPRYVLTMLECAPLTICRFRLQFAKPAYSCRFGNSSILLYTCLIVCLWNPQLLCKLANFWKNFQRYSVFAICLWNPKQQRKSRKSSNVADSATNLILVCCGIRIQFTKSPVWLRHEVKKRT